MLVTLIGGRNIHFYNIWVYVVVQKGWYLSVIIKKYSIICVIWLRHFLLFDFWPTMLQDFGTNSVNNYKAHFPFWHHQWLTQVNIVWDDFGYNLEKMTLLYSSPAYMSGLLDPTWGRDGPCILYIYILYAHLLDSSWSKKTVLNVSHICLYCTLPRTLLGGWKVIPIYLYFGPHGPYLGQEWCMYFCIYILCTPPGHFMGQEHGVNNYKSHKHYFIASIYNLLIF